MSWVLAVGATVAVGGAVLSSEGDKKAAKDLEKKLGPSNFLKFKLLQARASAAGKLEQMANKLEQGEPLSSSERTFLDSVVRQADLSIEENRKDTLSNVVGQAAGTGFLRSGRTQDQARRTNIEAESSRNTARITREKEALDRGFRRTVELPAQIRQGILTGAVAAPQTFIPQINSLQTGGQAASALGTSLIGIGGQQNASNTQADAIRSLAQQSGTGQGGVTAGGTSVQGGASASGGGVALQNLLKQLQANGQAVA